MLLQCANTQVIINECLQNGMFGLGTIKEQILPRANHNHTQIRCQKINICIQVGGTTDARYANGCPCFATLE